MPERKKTPPSVIFLLGVVLLLTLNALFTPAITSLTQSGAAATLHSEAHFLMPSLPPDLVGALSSVADGLGAGAAAATAILLFLYLVFMLHVVSQANGWKEAAPIKQCKCHAPSKDRIRRFAAIAIAVTVAAFMLKMAFSEPLLNNAGGVRRLVALKNFYLNFNVALASKARFDEQSFENRMFEALKFNSNDYLWFARSGYWAYDAGSGGTPWTRRNEYAAAELYKLFKIDLLRDEVIAEGAKLNSDLGNKEHAGEMIRQLSR